MSMMTRRNMLLRLGLGVPIVIAANPAQAVVAGLKLEDSRFSKEDDAFLEELGRATFRYFTDAAHPATGLVKDRHHITGKDDRPVASIAATGFGLAALCIADGRRWLPRGEAQQRAQTALQFLCERMPHEHGFFYHFVNWQTGAREWNCELSSIDTALLLCGALSCRQHFPDTEIRKWAEEIYERMDWVWMMNGGDLLTHGWKPESGFLKSRWDNYCEHMMLYLLAIGARQHAIPPAAWDAWKRPWFEYAGLRYITPREPLFVHQYSHAWIDFRGQRDRHVDYFENSVIATKAHRVFCASLAKRFPHFGDDVWGITASDSRKGSSPDISPVTTEMCSPSALSSWYSSFARKASWERKHETGTVLRSWLSIQAAERSPRHADCAGRDRRSWSLHSGAAAAQLAGG